MGKGGSLDSGVNTEERGRRGKGKQDTIDLIVVVGKWGAPEGARKEGNAGGGRR